MLPRFLLPGWDFHLERITTVNRQRRFPGDIQGRNQYILQLEVFFIRFLTVPTMCDNAHILPCTGTEEEEEEEEFSWRKKLCFRPEDH
jgi:hypothetical protein